ncbi:MAG: hypothetical protein WB562_02430, partial [Candidatus Sulfotelmatobacter sp.]
MRTRPVNVRAVAAKRCSFPSPNGRFPVRCSAALWVRIAAIALVFLIPGLSLNAREKDKADYGVGLIVNLPLPESEVAQVVVDVA